MMIDDVKGRERRGEHEESWTKLSVPAHSASACHRESTAFASWIFAPPEVYHSLT